MKIELLYIFSRICEFINPTYGQKLKKHFEIFINSNYNYCLCHAYSSNLPGFNLPAGALLCYVFFPATFTRGCFLLYLELHAVICSFIINISVMQFWTQKVRRDDGSSVFTYCLKVALFLWIVFNRFQKWQQIRVCIVLE